MSEGDHESWDDETMMTDNEPVQNVSHLFFINYNLLFFIFNI